ncbi:MAG TPA: tetratricopeptide repeat protein, partial [Fimbriimonas sp.]|nr:tetratricopeptide repeat protein [Fimbriimonas sp.]
PETRSLYRAIRAGTGSVAPQDRTVAAEPRLPKPLSSFLGRDAHTREVSSLLERCRLVTLTGVAGVGKTRLALAVAEAIKDNYLDGARFVDLSPLHDPNRVPRAIAEALGIQEQAGKPAIETLCERLRGCEMVVVLDNCEHLIQNLASTLDTLLSAASELRVLATSRQTIGVSGELVWRVPPLETPEPIPTGSDPSDCTSARAEYLLRSDAVQLFLHRSCQFEGGDTVSFEELETIGSICRRLDGMPLAIELAAARMKVLAASEIEARLENRFALLAGGSRTVPRHQTLNAAIEWSWDLLTDSERCLLMNLSAFRGGCTLEAAEAVALSCDAQGPVLDLLTNLVDRSLVVSTRREGSSRFSMLESIRQFAFERLENSEGFEETLRRHADYFVCWSEEVKTNLERPGEGLWFMKLEADHDNIRTALKWCQSRGEWEKALRMVVALARFWDTHGHVREGRAHIENLLSKMPTGMPPKLVSTAHVHAGWMAGIQGDCPAACSHYEETLAYNREIGDELGVAGVLNCLGLAHYHAGGHSEGRALLIEALSIFRKLGRGPAVGTVLNNIAQVELFLGNTAEARRCCEESLAAGGGIEVGDPQRRGLTLNNLAIADLRQGLLEDARHHALLAVRLFSEAEVVVSLVGGLDLAAVVLAQFQEWDRAARLFGASEQLASMQAMPKSDLYEKERDEAMAACREALGPSEFTAAVVLGRTMSHESAVRDALAAAAS